MKIESIEDFKVGKKLVYVGSNEESEKYYIYACDVIQKQERWLHLLDFDGGKRTNCPVSNIKFWDNWEIY